MTRRRHGLSCPSVPRTAPNEGDVMGRPRTEHTAGRALLGLPVSTILLALVGALGASGCIVDPVPTPGNSDDFTTAPGGFGGNGGTPVPFDAGPTSQGEADTADRGGNSKNDRDESAAFAGVPSPVSATTDLFGAILAGGGVPGPEAIDPLAFFAAHDLGVPPPTCGQTICLQATLRSSAELGVGEGCTLAWVGVRSAVSASLAVRPPLHVVVALEASAAVNGGTLAVVKARLSDLVKELSPGDRFSLVTFDAGAHALIAAAPVGVSVAGNEAILAAIDAIEAGGPANLYDGLFTAYALAAQHAKPGESQRVVLLAASAPSAGLTDPSRPVSLAAGWAAKGVVASAVVLGESIDPWLMRNVAEVGGGHFRLGWPLTNLGPALIAEVRTILLPVARDVRIEVKTGAGWSLGAVRGPTQWQAEGTGGQVQIPLLQVKGLAQGETLPANPAGTGWRNTAHGIAIGLRRPAAKATGDHVLRLRMRWRDLTTDTWHEQELVLKGPAGDGAVPPSWASHPTAGKAWAVHVLQRGLELAATLVAGAETGTSRLVLQTLKTGLINWKLAHPEHADDPDLAADLQIIELFDANVAALPKQTPAWGVPPLCPGG